VRSDVHHRASYKAKFPVARMNVPPRRQGRVRAGRVAWRTGAAIKFTDAGEVAIKVEANNGAFQLSSKKKRLSAQLLSASWPKGQVYRRGPVYAVHNNRAITLPQSLFQAFVESLFSGDVQTGIHPADLDRAFLYSHLGLLAERRA